MSRQVHKHNINVMCDNCPWKDGNATITYKQMKAHESSKDILVDTIEKQTNNDIASAIDYWKQKQDISE